MPAFGWSRLGIDAEPVLDLDQRGVGVVHDEPRLERCERRSAYAEIVDDALQVLAVLAQHLGDIELLVRLHNCHCSPRVTRG